MSNVQATIKWDARPYVDQVRKIIEDVIEEGAKATAEDAKRILERAAPDSTGTLASQIDVKASKYKEGGYIVEAQGPGNYNIITTPGGKVRRRYYASFVELGTSKMEGLGYLRKSLRRNKFRMRALIRRYVGELE